MQHKEAPEAGAHAVQRPFHGEAPFTAAGCVRRGVCEPCERLLATGSQDLGALSLGSRHGAPATGSGLWPGHGHGWSVTLFSEV